MIHKNTSSVRPEVRSVSKQLGKVREFANNLAGLAQDFSMGPMPLTEVQERLSGIHRDLGLQLGDRQTWKFCDASYLAHRTETSISVLPPDVAAKVRRPILVRMSLYKKSARQPLIIMEFRFDEGCIYRHRIIDSETETSMAASLKAIHIHHLHPDEGDSGL